MVSRIYFLAFHILEESCLSSWNFAHYIGEMCQLRECSLFILKQVQNEFVKHDYFLGDVIIINFRLTESHKNSANNFLNLF